MKYKTHLLVKFANYSGFNAICRRFYKNKALILMYHGICADGFSLLKDYDERQLPKSVFAQQIKYLQSKKYRFVTMTELVGMIKRKEQMTKCVVLTFDDGFRNIAKNAYPVMKKHGAKGCWYLVTDLIGTNNMVWTDFIETVVRNQPQRDFCFMFQDNPITYRLSDRASYETAMVDIKYKLRSISDKERRQHLRQFKNVELRATPKEFLMADWSTVTQCDTRILEIGSHTRQHPNCANLVSEEERETEIRQSKLILEKKTGLAIDHFCYPAGSYNNEVVKKVIVSGYLSAVSTDYGFNDMESDLFTLKRIEATSDFFVFKANVSGAYDIIRKVRDYFKQIKR